MNTKNLNIIFKSIFGSTLYGTNLPTSDVDYKGVFIPSMMEIIQPNIVAVKNFNTNGSKTKNSQDDVDEEYYALHKFFQMLINGDMNATEMLFCKNAVYSEDWNYIVKNKEKFLSNKIKGFVGYAYKQASRYSIRGDRLNETEKFYIFLKGLSFSKNSRVSDFADKIVEHIHNYEYVKIENIIVAGKELPHIKFMGKYIPYTVTLNTAIELVDSVYKEYGHRAKKAAELNGVDWKAIYHAHRICDEAIELLETKNIVFPRPNAEYLKKIRLGEIPYEEISEYLEDKLNIIPDISAKSDLPKEIDHDFIKDLQNNYYLEYVIKGYNSNV